MSTRPDKSTRRPLTRAVKQREREEAEARLPLPKPDLAALFDFLDQQLEGAPCDHSLRHTQAFLARRGLPEAALLPWLAEEGGHCDCEVLHNVENRWADRL